MKTIILVGLALAALLVVLAKAAVVRSHIRELKGHVEHCKEMCGPGRRTGDGTGEAPCSGTAG
jgi:hypothetical protein